MSKFTMELRTITQTTNIFDFDYPVYMPEGSTPDDMELRKKFLENMFINKFYFREIGFETIDRFKHYLRVEWLTKLTNFNIILSKQKDINPFIESKITSNNKSVFDDTPNTEIEGAVDFATNVTRHNNVTEGNTKTELELFNNYVNNLKNLDEDFINSFNNLFMMLY